MKDELLVAANAASKDANYQPLLDLMNKYNHKAGTTNLNELFQSTPKSHYSDIFEHLHQAVSTLIAKGESELATQENFCLATCLLIKDFLSEEERKAPESLFKLLQSYHDILFQMQSDGRLKTLQNQVLKLCEVWWSQNRGQRELLTLQTLPLLLFRSIDTDTNPPAVKRVFAMKDALQLLDFDDDSSESVKQLLQKCMIHPVYLRCSEGKKLLSFVFLLHPALISCFHEVIKIQLPSCKQTLLAAYGEIYFRSWKLSEGQFRLHIEKNCIQDLMYRSIHVASNSTAKAVRRVLSAFHEAKLQKGVDEMLCRLYSPILWRALTAANAAVRRNALALLIDAFPVQDSEESKDSNDSHMQKQFDCLQMALTDKDVDVRTIAVQGVGRILGRYWDLIPMNVVKAMITKLVTDLAFDSSSSSVRAAVFDCIGEILENALSHSMMSVVLPQLAPLIHDNVERVRLAFLDLLLSIKSMRSIRFFDVISVDTLLLRLSLDTSPCAIKLTQLLAPSYFPVNKSPGIQIARCLALLRENPQAACVFYSHLRHHVEIPSLARHILHLHGLLAASFKGEVFRAPDFSIEQAESEHKTMGSTKTGKKGNTDKKRKKAPEHTDSKDADDASQTSVSIDDQALIEAILETISIIWKTLEIDLCSAAHKALAHLLEKTFADGLMEQLLAKLNSEAARHSILSIASHISSNKMKALPETALPHLVSLPVQAPVSEYGPLISCMLAWGQSQQLVQSIMTGIQSGADNNSGKSSGRSRPLPISPVTAVKYLEYILDDPALRSGYFPLTNDANDAVSQVIHALSEQVAAVENILLDPHEKPTMDDSLAVSYVRLYGRMQMMQLQRKTAPKGSHVDIHQFDPLLQCVPLAMTAMQMVPAVAPAASKGKSRPVKKKASNASSQVNIPSMKHICHEVVKFSLQIISDLVSLRVVTIPTALPIVTSWFDSLEHKSNDSGYNALLSVFMKFSLCCCEGWHTLSANEVKEQLVSFQKYFSDVLHQVVVAEDDGVKESFQAAFPLLLKTAQMSEDLFSMVGRVLLTNLAEDSNEKENPLSSGNHQLMLDMLVQSSEFLSKCPKLLSTEAKDTSLHIIESLQHAAEQIKNAEKQKIVVQKVVAIKEQLELAH